MYSFSYLEPVCCSMSSSNCCFLTCIQISQEAGLVVWYSHLFQNFPNRIHFSLHVTIQSINSSLLLHRKRDDTSKRLFFLIFDQLMRHPFINLLQMLNDHRMVNIEFFTNFSCSCKKISFDDLLDWSLSTSNGQPLLSLSSRISFPLQNFLNHHCTIHLLTVPGPNCLNFLFFS